MNKYRPTLTTALTVVGMVLAALAPWAFSALCGGAV